MPQYSVNSVKTAGNYAASSAVTTPVSNNYQTSAIEAQALQNKYLVEFSNDKMKNLTTGHCIINQFNRLYPNVQSSTMMDIKAKQTVKTNPASAQVMQEQADKCMDKYVEMLDNNPLKENFSNENYINQIKQNIVQYNIANCGEMAYLVQDELNKKGIDNKVIEIGGDKNYQSHVFNVIGMDKNANPSDPSTYGKNAVVIDTWAKKVMPFDDAVKYYNDFFLYNENNSTMTFKEDKLDEIREKTINTLKPKYEQKTGKPISMEDFGNLTYKEIFSKNS